MRVLTWNVLWGGQGAGQRLEGILRTIAAARPDVVALQECSGWHERQERTLRQVATRLGMEAHPFWTPSGFHLVVLARIPATTVHHDDQDAFTHGYQHVVLAPRPGTAWHFFNTHLDPRSEEVRLAEMRAILAAMGPHRRGLCSLTGDMNSLAPGDLIDGVRVRRRFRLDLLRHPYLRGKFHHSGLSGAAEIAPRGAPKTPFHDRRLIRRVEMRGDVQALLRARGWVDAYRRLAPDDPGYTGPSDAPLFRIDYVHLSPRLARALVRCEPMASPAIRRASDHLPLLWEVDLAPGQG